MKNIDSNMIFKSIATLIYTLSISSIKLKLSYDSPDQRAQADVLVMYAMDKQKLSRLLGDICILGCSKVQMNFNGLITFGTMKTCLRRIIQASKC